MTETTQLSPAQKHERLTDLVWRLGCDFHRCEPGRLALEREGLCEADLTPGALRAAEEAASQRLHDDLAANNADPAARLKAVVPGDPILDPDLNPAHPIVGRAHHEAERLAKEKEMQKQKLNALRAAKKAEKDAKKAEKAGKATKTPKSPPVAPKNGKAPTAPRAKKNATGAKDTPAVAKPAPTPEPARETKPKAMSCLDAAHKVLGESDDPMTSQELIDAMAAKKYWTSPGGKTPAATLYSAMIREIANKGAGSRFRREGKKFAFKQ